MSYVCPVCSSPQTDAEHLANHLAFTAMLRGDGHEEWLDEHAPDWAEQGPETLAPTVAEHVPETETELDEDDDQHTHDAQPSFERSLAQQGGYGRDSGAAPSDPEAERILAEAERMTQRMRGESESEDADGETAERADEAADEESEEGEEP